jgi:hypothetical protein
MQAEMFVPRCAGAGCHGSMGPALGLDLVSSGLEARLLGAPSIGCRGERLLVAGQPEQSELFRKVAHASPECGARMPVALPAYGEADLECLRRWITSLSPPDAAATDVAPTADTGRSDGADGAADAAGPACPAGQTLCGQLCVNLQSSAANCGACGKTCTTGALCSMGGCVRTGCPAGTTECAGACLSTASDPLNCGACGKTCATGAGCGGGVCTCPPGLTACGSSCVDTATSPANCGGCGRTCSGADRCVAGGCVGCGPSVSFAAQIQPIFNAGCTTNCHSGNRPAGGLGLGAGVARAELVNVTSSCRGRKQVAPGSPETSYLMNKLMAVDMCSGSVMPKMGGELSPAQIDVVRAWICQGAPDN